MSLIKNPSRILSRSSADPYPGVRGVTVAIDFYRFAVVARSYHRGTFLFKFFSARDRRRRGFIFSSRVSYFIRDDRLSTISGKASGTTGTTEDDNGRYDLR